MPAAVQNMFARLAAALKSFTVAQRTIAVILLAAVVLGAVALTSWLTKPSYTPLFTGIAPTDASAIVEQLRTDGVPYELTAGGATILVPEANVYDERLKAAAAGLPPTNSGGGYSLLDTMGVTSSEFQQNVTYKRAIEGELAKTIQAMDGVKTASVQLAIPEKTVFVAEEKDPTASVFIETQAGATPRRQAGPGDREPDQRLRRGHEADRRGRHRRVGRRALAGRHGSRRRRGRTRRATTSRRSRRRCSRCSTRSSARATRPSWSRPTWRTRAARR